jgi:hypothetical protein
MPGRPARAKMQGTMMSYPLTLVHLLDWQWGGGS